MKKIMTTLLVAGSLFTSSLLFSAVGSSSDVEHGSYDTIAIIGNKNNPVEYITYDELYLIFTMRKTRWDSGLQIKTLYLPFGSQDSIRFAHTVLGIPAVKFYKIVQQTARKYRIDVNMYNTKDDVYKVVLVDPKAVAYGDTFEYEYVKHFKIIE